MRITLILLLTLLMACRTKPVMNPCNLTYHLEISSHNYSMAYTLNYIVENDSLKVTFYDGISGKPDSLLLVGKLTDSVSLLLCDHLASFDIDTLKEEYINRHIEDGDRKSIILMVGNKTKKVYTANYKQDQLVKIYDILNMMVDEKYRIRYYKPTKISLEDFGR
ncbi:hypothetical protein [Chitinophaga sp. CB10]|uniref:hypothetical protein n=1 Tax=Chitinophaga sp. CB10 TaxID=1891659 RepID=UPI0025C5FC34|nr:hypothetical protein [Chitinophaga sp. CB10]